MIKRSKIEIQLRREIRKELEVKHAQEMDEIKAMLRINRLSPWPYLFWFLRVTCGTFRKALILIIVIILGLSFLVGSAFTISLPWITFRKDKVELRLPKKVGSENIKTKRRRKRK